MFKTAAIVIVASWLAFPVSANPTIEFMERQLEVEPGAYTLNELVQIQNAGSEAASRMELIDRKKAAFRRAVHQAMRESGLLSTSSFATQ